MPSRSGAVSRLVFRLAVSLMGCAPRPVAAPAPTDAPVASTGRLPDLPATRPLPRIHERRRRADLSGDGLADYAVGAPAANSVTVYVSTAAAGVTLSRPSGSFGAALVYAGDLDHDGFGDLAVGAPDDDTVWLFGGRATGVDPVPRAAIRAEAGSGFGATLCAVGDLDGDGRDDLLVGSVHGHRVSFVRGTLGAAPTTVDDTLEGPAGEGFATSLVALDDGTGRVAVGVPGEGSVAIVTARRGRLEVRERVVVAAGPVVALEIAALDADGDGRVDLAVASGGSGGIVWLYGRGEGFGAPIAGPQGVGSGSVLASAGDLDGDGAEDLLMASGARLWLLPGVPAGRSSLVPWFLEHPGRTASLAVVRDADANGVLMVLRGLPGDDAVERLIVGHDVPAVAVIEPLSGTSGSLFGMALAR